MQMQERMPEIITGFESTHIFGTGLDVLDLTHHTEFFEYDFELVRSMGIKKIRYSIPWHKIEREKERYDWKWMDQVMAVLRGQGIEIIADPLHHVSFPDWLKGGFRNPMFPIYYEDFVRAFALRYPHVREYTIVNEPYATTFLAHHEGVWYPFEKVLFEKTPWALYVDPSKFLQAAANVALAIANISHKLQNWVDSPRVLQVDSCENHVADDGYFHDELNERKFLLHDMCLGRAEENQYFQKFKEHVTKRNCLVAYNALRNINRNPARIDEFGLDYYAHHDWYYPYGKDAYHISPRPRGFAYAAKQYFDRYKIPIFVGETNLRGTIPDRITWFNYMMHECAKVVESGIAISKFCWYPAIDSVAWGNMVREKCQRRDPTGVWWLSPDCKTRNHSAFPEIVSQVIRGKTRIDNLPAYRFHPPLDHEMRGFTKQMEEYVTCWRKQELLPEVTERRKPYSLAAA